MVSIDKERLKDIIDSLIIASMGTPSELYYEEQAWFQQTILSLIDRMPTEGFTGIVNNDKLADAIAKDCHDPGHDIRWCGTCETREAAIFDYRESIRKALNIKATP